VLNDAVAYLAITERSYPKKLALTYLEDVRAEFQTSYKREDIHDPQLRPYAYSEFDRFIERTKKTYQDSRATDNLSRLNDELKGVTQVMTKNIEDLLYRGDSLEKMGEHDTAHGHSNMGTDIVLPQATCHRGSGMIP
jgi:vesicle transport protein SEC22